jgi:AcrR family transcriptional regulator
MPLPTFFNLESGKREALSNAAYQEFAFNSYQAASVSTIVKEIGIAKGSFYRYFKNKVDLYTFLIENAFEKRRKFQDGLLENESVGFFEILRENLRRKILFDLAHPLESIFIFNVLQETNAPEVKPLADEMKRENLLFLSGLVAVFQKKGELNPSVSPELISQLIFQARLGMYEYLAIFKGIDFKELVRNGQLVPLTEKEGMAIADEMLMVVKSGLSV